MSRTLTWPSSKRMPWGDEQRVRVRWRCLQRVRRAQFVELHEEQTHCEDSGADVPIVSKTCSETDGVLEAKGLEVAKSASIAQVAPEVAEGGAEDVTEAVDAGVHGP